MTKKKKTILIVEDEESLLKALDIKLTQEGYKTEKATDGEEGLKKFEKKIPDLVLLDIKMPKMDGLTMLKKLREKSKGKEVPVIILTNWGEMDKISKAIELETKYYLIKTDWDLDEVIQKVKSVLKK
ncbi:response regulator [Patescibacteria group bacterium]